VQSQPFDHEIFISYAHLDDASLIEGQKGWISQLHRALEVRVSQLAGRQVRVWRDPKLQGNDLFADRLLETLPRAAVLVSVLSPRYVASEWCVRELQEFWRASERTGGAAVAGKIRVFKIVKTPVPLERHPAEVRDVLGYEFFTVDPESGRPRELRAELGADVQTRYWSKLDDLAHDIAELLELLDNGVGAGAAAAASSGETVYLAASGLDLAEAREDVKRNLERRGHQVLPDRVQPVAAPDLEAAVLRDLASCRLSVHMIGKSYGFVPDGAERSVVAIQHDLAIERGGGGGFERLLWIPPGLEVDDERQRAYLREVRTDPRLQAGADLLEVPLEDLKAAIHRKLEPEEEAAAPAPAGAGAEGPATVYLLVDRDDAAGAAPLEDLLYERGYEVVLPVFDGDETEIREDHEENLRTCDGVLIYYGTAHELWLRKTLRELRKCAGYGRERPLAAKAVCLAPPPTPDKERLRTHEALVIRLPEGELGGALGPFFDQLGADGGSPGP
jgi:hypothetical protein